MGELLGKMEEEEVETWGDPGDPGDDRGPLLLQKALRSPTLRGLWNWSPSSHIAPN